jgi:hypothetical protein
MMSMHIHIIEVVMTLYQQAESLNRLDPGIIDQFD